MAGKTICLMRHSEAVVELSPSVSKDFDKPLTDNGINQLESVRTQLKLASFLPDVVLCSPSVRTRQTLEWIQEVLGTNVDVVFDEELYGIEAGRLIEKIQELSDEQDSVLVIGHNPSISDAIQCFANGVHNSDMVTVTLPVQPGQFAIFNSESTSWMHVLNHPVHLETIFNPVKIV